MYDEQSAIILLLRFTVIIRVARKTAFSSYYSGQKKRLALLGPIRLSVCGRKRTGWDGGGLPFLVASGRHVFQAAFTRLV